MQRTSVAMLRKANFAFISSRILHVMGHYKVFDQMENGPRTALEIAAALNLREENLYRMLAVLANDEILQMMNPSVAEEPEGEKVSKQLSFADQVKTTQFSLNNVSRLLLSSHPHSQQAFSSLLCTSFMWNVFGQIEKGIIKEADSAQTDIFQEIYKEHFFAYLQKDPRVMQVFNDGITSYTSIDDETVVKLLSFPKMNEEETATIDNYHIHCDVAGGAGQFLYEILKHNPSVKGINLEFAAAIQDSEALCAKPFGNRYQGVVGDAFIAIPPAHSYSMKYLLHALPNEKAVEVLSNCRKAMLRQHPFAKEGAHEETQYIYVIDCVLPNEPDGSNKYAMDILMMALPGSRERNLHDFRCLGEQAGLTFMEKRDAPNLILSVLVFRP